MFFSLFSVHSAHEHPVLMTNCFCTRCFCKCCSWFIWFPTLGLAKPRSHQQNVVQQMHRMHQLPGKALPESPGAARMGSFHRPPKLNNIHMPPSDWCLVRNIWASDQGWFIPSFSSQLFYLNDRRKHNSNRLSVLLFGGERQSR